MSCTHHRLFALTWDTQIFVGVLESLNVTYVLFTPEGVPLRAKLSVALKEYRPAAVQVKESPTFSPDFEKTYVVRRGDTLSSVAAAVYRNAGAWREIARDQPDPRSTPVGARKGTETATPTMRKCHGRTFTAPGRITG